MVYQSDIRWTSHDFKLRYPIGGLTKRETVAARRVSTRADIWMLKVRRVNSEFDVMESMLYH